MFLMFCVHEKHTIKSACTNGLPDDENMLFEICRRHQELNNNNNNSHISVTEVGHLLTRSSSTYPEVSSKVCHNSFCQMGIAFHYPG